MRIVLKPAGLAFVIVLTASVLILAYLRGRSNATPSVAATTPAREATSAPVNRLANGDFESGATTLGGWTNAANIPASLVPGEQSGHALRVEADVPGWKMLTQTVALPPRARTVRLTLRVRTASLREMKAGDPPARDSIQFAFFDRGDSPNGKAGRVGDYTGLPIPQHIGAWVTLERDAAVPPGATHAEVLIGVHNRVGAVVYDDVSLTVR